jgi:hypothetical protein
MKVRITPSSFFYVSLLILALSMVLFPEEVSQTFDPNEIQILMNPDIDIIYHTLAYFSVPGDPSNLYSPDYASQIRKGKEDLEVGQTKLDLMCSRLEQSYRQLPRLRFLNLAPFMADDYASFKEALLMIDYKVEKEMPEDTRESLEDRKARGNALPLLFGNAKRLIPLFQKRFPDPQEREFVKQFAECMEDEQSKFYKMYREARTEIDQQNFEKFIQFWKSEGSRILWPWAAKSGVNVFNIYLSPVMKNNGRGIPVNQDRRIFFNLVAPLPETRDQRAHALFVILHETTHRLTDNRVGASEADSNTARENAAFYGDHLYLKSHYPQYHSDYLKYFLNLAGTRQFDLSSLENQFLKSYPLSPSLKTSVAELVKGL